MIHIRKPRGISTVQLMVVTLVGFAGGIYIWKPLFQALRTEPIADAAVAEATATTSTTNNQS